ncbi:MAG TPA: DNA integrity scanning diadenylate cyclase DisA [Actinomycetota bacterium]|nr:DNA integrity scanning diadenylate cyclase DisA [Actinomycetota bacterium]
MQDKTTESLLGALAKLAPGTALRDGLERILRGETGALLVLGHNAAVGEMSSSGFSIDEEFTPQRLSELAKMDGAIIISEQAERILRANVHLVPDPSIPTLESGTRHRTADRVARQCGFPVVAVSQSMRTVTVYLESDKRVLEDVTAVLARANQALQTLERYKQRLNEVSNNLLALEVEDLATLRDAIMVVQRIEMVMRIASEVDALVIELGTEGRLMRLQLDELIGGVDLDRKMLLRDHVASRRSRSIDPALKELSSLSPEELLDPIAIAKVLGYPATGEALDAPSSPRGYRILSRIPRLPPTVVDRIVAAFGKLPKIMAASTDDLLAVEGVGAARAALVKDGLVRLAESSILDRYL